MKSIDEVEHLLRQIPAPHLAEGPHREQLKQQLLMQLRSVPREEKKMNQALFARMSPTLKVAAMILAAALLLDAGWAAEKIYEKLKLTKASLILEEHPVQEWKLPNGVNLTTTGTMATAIKLDDPKAIETAKRHLKEVKELIGQKKYKLLRTFPDESTGGTEYVYTFTFSDGTQDTMNFSLPLDNVASWDDYQRKVQHQTQHYQEQVNEAIAKGRYRLIDQDVLLLHICMDEASHQKTTVQRIHLLNGDEIALYRSYEVAAEEQATTQPQSTWQEHLQAIREGKLELLGVETIPIYKYEVVFEDGQRRIFEYGGGDPLKEAEAD